MAQGGGWKNQSPTPNVNTRYMYFFINTRQDGPVVVKLPPAVPGASFYGTIEDAWYVPLTDIGFEGKGGKYLVLPPDYKGEVPDGYIAVRPATYNTMTLLRSILASLSEKDVKAGNGLVQQVKVYPLSKAANPPAQRLLDMTDVMFNGLIKYDETFFISLARVLNEETLQPRDLQMMGMLLPLGIERGKEFKPAAMPPLLQATRAIPIVFNNVADPVGAGFVDTLSRPGSNATGFIQSEYTLSGKWLELLREITPGVKRAAVLRDATISAGVGQFAVIQSVAPTLGIETSAINLSDAGEIEHGVTRFAKAPDGGLIVTASVLSVIHRERIIELAARHKLPTVYYRRYFVDRGGLVSYGYNNADQFRGAAGYVDRILKGGGQPTFRCRRPISTSW